MMVMISGFEPGFSLAYMYSEESGNEVRLAVALVMYRFTFPFVG